MTGILVKKASEETLLVWECGSEVIMDDIIFFGNIID